MILYDLPWAEAQRYRAVIEERLTPPADQRPTTLGSLHERLHAKTRGHG